LYRASWKEPTGSVQSLSSKKGSVRAPVAVARSFSSLKMQSQKSSHYTHPRPAADLANAPPISDSDATLSSSESFPEAAPSSAAALSTYAVWQ